jgi:putative redox protein
VSRIAHTALDLPVGYAATLQAGRHVLSADEPAALGGTDTGPSPYQLLLAGLAACTAITLRMYGDRKGWQLGAIHVDLELHKDSPESTGRIQRVISFSEPLDEQQRSRLAEIAQKTPVTRTILAGAPIVTELR